MALNEFEGSVMLVSHDRALLREVCDEFWLVVDGGVEELDADLDEYQRWLLEVSRARRAAARRRRGRAASLRRPRSPRRAHAAHRRAAAPSPAAGKRRDERKQQAQSRAQLANRTRPLRMEVAADRRPPRKTGRRKGRTRGRAGANGSVPATRWPTRADGSTTSPPKPRCSKSAG